MKLLILSDGKPGHVNQSIAFARLLGRDYEVCRVGFRARALKAVSLVLSRLGIYSRALFEAAPVGGRYGAVVSAGSETYYANKALAKHLGIPAVAIMLPRGYGFDFDLIVAQQHDRPPERANILALPVNLSHPVPAGLVQPSEVRPVVSLVIGGPSRHFRMDALRLRQQMRQIWDLFPGGDFLVTSSRRTPAEVEALLEEFPFRYRLIYSREPVNPVPDFLAMSDYVFVTEDSTSMISEAVCTGSGAVEVLPLDATGERNKVGRMVQALKERGCLHVFDGSLGGRSAKLDLAADLKGRAATILGM